MKISQSTFLQKLEKSLFTDLEEVQYFTTLNDDELNYSAQPNSWSILECMHHLNLYAEFYIPHFDRLISSSENLNKPIYKSGWLGNYFAEMMDIQNGKKISKMSSPKDKNPKGIDLNRNVLTLRIEQVKTLQMLINQAKTKNLEKKRCPITISKWITIQLGDAMHFIINHEKRHTIQAVKVLQFMKSKDSSTLL